MPRSETSKEIRKRKQETSKDTRKRNRLARQNGEQETSKDTRKRNRLSRQNGKPDAYQDMDADSTDADFTHADGSSIRQ